jgi:TDG/mug DNA glycosylase family protein
MASYCFPPLVCQETRVLILGSLPGQVSLQATEYYAHPRNQFWRLLGEIVQQPLSTLSYPERVSCMLAAGVGLWDVVGSAERAGSLDSDLRQVNYNDLPALVLGLPDLQLIAFNGAAAARGKRMLTDMGIELLQLPSSSPAFTQSYANKLAVWLCIRPYL